MDCFVAKAPRNDAVGFRFNFKQQMCVIILAARFARGLLKLAALSNQRARGGRAPDAPDSRVCMGSG
jgi:hypothetical protein